MFATSTYLVYDLFANGFNGIILTFCIFGYLSAHYLWPKHHDEESAWYDFLEVIVDLPFRTLAFLLRSIGRVGKAVDDGVALDL